MKIQAYRVEKQDGGSAWESKRCLSLQDIEIIDNISIYLRSVVVL
jgi:hypothetical protein